MHIASTGVHVFLTSHLFERSEFLIATSKKKSLRVCSTNLGFSEVRVMYQIRMYLVSAGRNEVGYRKVAWMLFSNSCRCSVGGETIRLSSQSSRVRYSAPLFFSFFFLHGRWCPLYVCSFFFATRHPPVITTCSWGSVGRLPCTSHRVRL